MSALVIQQLTSLIAVIQPAAVPALRVAFTVAVLAMGAIGLYIYHKRHQLFDQDPAVDTDTPVARHNRLEEVIFVYSGMLLALLSILYQLWRA